MQAPCRSRMRLEPDDRIAASARLEAGHGASSNRLRSSRMTSLVTICSPRPPRSSRRRFGRGSIGSRTHCSERSVPTVTRVSAASSSRSRTTSCGSGSPSSRRSRPPTWHGNPRACRSMHVRVLRPSPTASGRRQGERTGTTRRRRRRRIRSFRSRPSAARSTRVKHDGSNRIALLDGFTDAAVRSRRASRPHHESYGEPAQQAQTTAREPTGVPDPPVTNGASVHRWSQMSAGRALPGRPAHRRL